MRLKLARKIRLFEMTRDRKRERLFVDGPVVSGDSLAIACKDEFVTLDRQTLETRWRGGCDGLEPFEAWDEQHVLVRNYSDVGMYDVAQQQLLWRRPGGAWRWRDGLLLVRTGSPIRLHDPLTGESVHDVASLDYQPCGVRVCGDLLLCGSTGNREPLRAFTLPEGRLAWERDLAADLRTTFGVDVGQDLLMLVPGSVPDTFLVTTTGYAFQASLADGHLNWKADKSITHFNVPAWRGGVPVFQDSSTSFYLIDEASGALRYDRWYPELVDVRHSRAGVLMAEETIAYVSESGRVALFSLADGELLWTRAFRVYFQGAVCVDGRLLVTAGDGNLWVFEQEGQAAKPKRAKAQPMPETIH